MLKTDAFGEKSCNYSQCLQKSLRYFLCSFGLQFQVGENWNDEESSNYSKCSFSPLFTGTVFSVGMAKVKFRSKSSGYPVHSTSLKALHLIYENAPCNLPHCKNQGSYSAPIPLIPPLSPACNVSFWPHSRHGKTWQTCKIWVFKHCSDVPLGGTSPASMYSDFCRLSALQKGNLVLQQMKHEKWALSGSVWYILVFAETWHQARSVSLAEATFLLEILYGEKLKT